MHELHCSRYGTRLLLVPMVHIADAAFYASVNERLNNCDNLIIEGVRSFRTRLLTLSYKIPARRKSLRLTLQRNQIRPQELDATVIHGDVSAAEFALSWADVPWYERLVLLLVAPAIGIGLFIVGSRQLISRGHSVDSIPAESGATGAKSSAKFEKAILHDRDRHLLARIEEHVLANPDKEQLTAILFGGRHMPAIAEVLMSGHGYRVKKSDWLTAIAA